MLKGNIPGVLNALSCALSIASICSFVPVSKNLKICD